MCVNVTVKPFEWYEKRYSTCIQPIHFIICILSDIYVYLCAKLILVHIKDISFWGSRYIIFKTFGRHL